MGLYKKREPTLRAGSPEKHYEQHKIIYNKTNLEFILIEQIYVVLVNKPVAICQLSLFKHDFFLNPA